MIVHWHRIAESHFRPLVVQADYLGDDNLYSLSVEDMGSRYQLVAKETMVSENTSKYIGLRPLNDYDASLAASWYVRNDIWVPLFILIWRLMSALEEIESWTLFQLHRLWGRTECRTYLAWRNLLSLPRLRRGTD